MKQIIFTKLGTVKFNDKEYTCEDFFQLVKRNISFDIDKNYIMYDEENNHFVIKIDNTNYQVLYGQENITKYSDKKDIVKSLRDLIEFSEQKRIEQKGRKEVHLSEKVDKKKIIENGDKGIFNSDEDKLVYIEYLDKEIKRIKSLNDMPISFPIIFGGIPLAIVVTLLIVVKSLLPALIFLLLTSSWIVESIVLTKDYIENLNYIRQLEKKKESLKNSLSKKAKNPSINIHYKSKNKALFNNALFLRKK